MPKQPPIPLLFDANAPTLKNNHEPIKAQIASSKHKSRNPKNIKTIKRHLLNYFSVNAFMDKFLLFALDKKKFDPHPPAHIYQSTMVNSSWYEYHLIDLLQATRQPIKDMLAKIQAHIQRIEQANELAKKREYDPQETIAQIAQLYKGGMGDVGESICRAAFGYMGYYADLKKCFLRYQFANGLDCQIYHLTRYLELLDTLPEYEHLPEAQRDEQLRVIFSDYLNIK